MNWFIPRELMKPHINVGRYQQPYNTTMYINNYYDGSSTGGLWNGYYSRMSAQDTSIPIRMTSNYYYSNYSCGYPSWLERSIENNYMFSFMQNMINGGGGCQCQ